jgi:hypothetical protein
VAMPRRARDPEERDAAESGEHDQEEKEMRAAGGQAIDRLACGWVVLGTEIFVRRMDFLRYGRNRPPV